MQKQHRWMFFMVPTLLALAFLACDDDTTAPQQGTAVEVKDNEFEPRNLLVTSNQTITWTWSGSNQHNVTFDDPSIGNSIDQATGLFTKAFVVSGAYAYHCTIHGAAVMSGTVTVQ